jgi:peptidoglycan/LPS O-acetylase OafA/YrhL
MAWNGEMRPFVAGVKRAVIAGIILPLLMVMFGYDVYMLGTRAAVQHGAFGFVLSLIALEFLLRPERLPLTCSARPMGNLKALGPIYLMLLFVIAYNLGLLERAALVDFRKFAMLLGSLGLIYAGLRLSQRRQSILSRIEFDDLPDTPTQRLGLSEPV